MSNQFKGLMITTLGVLFIVPDSLFVRLIDAEPMVTASWRGLMSGFIVLAAILIFQGPREFSSVRHSGWAGVTYVLLLGSTTPAFVLAVANTSVANVVFIFASSPIFAAFFSRVFLGEPIQRRMIITMAVVIVGLAVVAYGTGSSETASWKGDAWALYVSAAYAAALTAVRRAKHISMVPAIPIAYIGSGLVIWLFQSPLPAFEMLWPLFLAHGLFIGIASVLLTIGPRYLSSAEVSLLILLESVLAPILVWAVIGEYPGNLTLLGGAIVIGALVVSNIYLVLANKRRRV